MKPEWYFLMYAFPCGEMQLQIGQIEKQELDTLRGYFLKKEAPSREFLEQMYKPAIRRIKKLAESMNKHHWDMEVLEAYWRKEHNNAIDNEDGKFYVEASETFKDLCRVHIAEITKKTTVEGQLVLVVKYNRKTRVVLGTHLPEAEVGNKVTIHYGFAVELVN